MSWPTIAEWAAYLGAAAWLPQVGSWIHHALAKPIITLVPLRLAQIGFSNFGPVIKLQVAAFATRRDVVLVGLSLTLRHVAGDGHQFSWITIGETFADLTDSSTSQSVSMRRDRPAIAVRVEKDSMIERDLTFQGQDFSNGITLLNNALTTQLHFLRQKGGEFWQQASQSRVFHDMLQFCETTFLWKPGRYVVDIDAQTWEGVGRLEMPGIYAFELSPADVDALKINLVELHNELINAVNADNPKFKRRDSQWVTRQVHLVDA